jgi:hypothetical protein
MTGTTALTAGRPDPGEAGQEAETDGREPTRPGSTPLKRLLGWYALSRLVTLAAAIAAGIRYPGFGLIRFFSAWDAGWYLKLIAFGYPHGIPQVAGRATESTIGFFPLFPMVVRAVSWALPGSDAVAAIGVSLVAGGVTVVLLYRLACLFTDRRAAERGAILFAFFPGSLVLSMPYTEALMLALSVGALLAALRHRWLTAGLLAALATACRPTAGALVPALAWQAAVAIRHRREWRALLAPALAPLGTLAYFVFLRIRTGDFMAWFRVEKEGWGQGPKLGWYAFRPVGDFLRSPFGDIGAAILGLGLIFVLVTLAILLVRRWPGTLTVYTLTILAMSANARLDAVRPRALLATFPLILAAGSATRGRRFLWAVGISAAVLFFLTLQYNTLQLDQI